MSLTLQPFWPNAPFQPQLFVTSTKATISTPLAYMLLLPATGLLVQESPQASLALCTQVAQIIEITGFF